MSADFYATETQKCGECGYRINVGEVVRWNDEGKLIHSKHVELEPWQG